ncbi:hypothetical protein CEY15_11315 [Dietzia natronolimnaea]|uniref:Uncharacterized protein n=1 Tax=Dietzia natronolimnaea TaxID=161920 RepID=A0A2A2WNY4_9ACTN|nr:hypothetical protein [Dietzia natronolimnaea]PAY22908.1 hypothetical protein CEY15_11315 [Dietzia natronolimnaea]
MAEQTTHTPSTRTRRPVAPWAGVRLVVVVTYLFLLVGWPLLMIVQRTFFDGSNHLVSGRSARREVVAGSSFSGLTWATELNGRSGGDRSHGRFPSSEGGR